MKRKAIVYYSHTPTMEGSKMVTIERMTVDNEDVTIDRLKFSDYAFMVSSIRQLLRYDFLNAYTCKFRLLKE